MTRIGFIGLGKMGLPMAVNLLKAGHDIVGYDVVETAMDAFVSAGGRVSSTVLDVASNREVMITMLQTGAQVESVALGAMGFLSILPQGSLYIDCSTIDVVTSQRVHQAASEKRIFSLDAPVSGGVIGAINGALTIMIGGSDEAYQRSLPILELVGKKIIYAGKDGLGQVAKMCNNLALGVIMMATSEAFVLADAWDLPRNKLFEIVRNASGNSWVMENYVPVPELLQNVPANNHYEPGFSTAMMLKDLNLAVDMAHAQGLLLSLAQFVQTQYQKLNDEGKNALDFSAIFTMIQNQTKYSKR